MILPVQNSQLLFKSKMPLKTTVNQSVEKIPDRADSKKIKLRLLILLMNVYKKTAKRESLKNDSCSYEDYLQNLRLHFLEELEENRNGKIYRTCKR